METTLTVTLSDDEAQTLRDSVEAGEFASAEEALRGAVLALKRERAEHEEVIASIRDRVRRSIEDPASPVTVDDARRDVAAFCAQLGPERL
jgi:antitoxin ParD1/3/4